MLPFTQRQTDRHTDIYISVFELYKTGEILTVLSDTLYVPLRKVELLTESLGRKEASCCSVSTFSSSLSLYIYIYFFLGGARYCVRACWDLLAQWDEKGKVVLCR